MADAPPPYPGDKGPYAPEGYAQQPYPPPPPQQHGYAPQGYPPPQGMGPQGAPMGAYPTQSGYAPVPTGPPAYSQAPYAAYPTQTLGAPGTTVVVTQPATTVVVRQNFNQYPIAMMCPHCSAQITTGVTYQTSGFTWLICFLLCIVGCDLGCCLIPFCIDSCKDAIHSCPNCRQIVGQYRRL